MSSDRRKPSALVSLTNIYSDSESDNESEDNSNDYKSETNERIEDRNKDFLSNALKSQTNSPTNTLFQSIESLDKRRDSINESIESYNDFECLDLRPDSPVSYHKSLFGKSEDQIVIPSEPTELCSKSLQEKFTKLYEKMKMGSNNTTIIQKRKDFRNPSIYEKLIAFCGIDEMATNYPQDIYDPHLWTQHSFYEELAKKQKEDLERRERERKDKTKVEFISGTKKGQNSDSNESIKKKSKWDLPNTAPNSTSNQSQINLMRPQIVIPVSVATGTKPIVISASGTIGKKSK